MNQRSSSLWIVALVALAGILRLSSSPGSLPTARSISAESESGAPQKPADPITTDKAVGNLLNEYYSSLNEEYLKHFRDEHGRAVIALVPDPIDTRIAYRFDETVEAIQTGAQDARYILDRFWLPWPTKSGARDETFRSIPGVIVFRRGPSTSGDPLVVLLVGETPTAGVHGKAFDEAIAQARRLDPDAEDVRIVGPNFSGSVRSLQTALKKRLGEVKRIRFFSGNTTSLEARQSLVALAPKQIEFYGTVLPDKVTELGVKDYFERLKSLTSPDLIFTHWLSDRHQDHRTISELTWNTFRSHLILEYEIPKYEGDLGHPNLFVPVAESSARRKVSILREVFRSQHEKKWFTDETFWALMRLRGVEGDTASGYAEAFHARKTVAAIA